jgi:hypothetical protein
MNSFTPVGGSDDAKKFGMVGILQNVAAGAGLNRRHDSRIFIMNRQHQDLHVRETALDQAGSRNPVEPRHIYVHQDHIGFGFHRQIEGLAPVGRFSDHSQVRFSFEEQPKALPKEPLILGNQ